MATRRIHANSVNNAVKAMLNASLEDLRPPEHVRLRDGDEPFWVGVVRARARDEWTETDLVVAAQLARCLHDIEREQVCLDAEGAVVVNDKGTQIVNPRVSVLEQYARREMALMRTLRMGGYSPDKQLPNLLNARKTERQARKVKDELADELLA